MELKKLVTAGLAASLGVVAFANEWYVDAVSGKDTNDGKTSETPFQTIRAATAQSASGDVIKVAEGTYGTLEGAEKRVDSATSLCRVILPAGVTLEATGKAENTIIVGAPSTDGSADTFKNGPGAVRCVFAEAGSTIRGFTLTGGHTAVDAGSDNDNVGGAVRTDDALGVTIENCMISNNYSRLATICNARALRDWIVGNYAGDGANNEIWCPAGRACEYIGCVIDGNRGSATIGNAVCIESCTIGSNNRDYGGYTVQVLHSPKGGGVAVVNSLFLGSAKAYSGVYATNCYYNSSITIFKDEMCLNCVSVAAESISVDDDYRPIIGKNVAIDKADADYSTAAIGETDLLGGQRVMNGAMDVGAVEADWTERYETLLGGEMTVTSVSPSAFERSGSFVLPAGSLAGHIARAGKYRISFSVSGTGTATVALDGKTAGEYAAGEIDFTCECAESALAFSFAGEGAIEGLRVEHVGYYWYVDVTSGRDTNDGKTSGTPFQTIRAATAQAVSGDVIHVAPGTYGEQEGAVALTDRVTRNRVILPEGVSLVSAAGAANTFIVGAASDDDEASEHFGNGPNAIRCVYAEEGAMVRGFTLTGGHTCQDKPAGGTDDDTYGAAVFSSSSSDRVLVVDCIVSNNAVRLGTLHRCNVVRCRVTGNRSSIPYNGSSARVSGVGGNECGWYGCIVADNGGLAALLSPQGVYSCTIGTNYYYTADWEKDSSSQSLYYYGVPYAAYNTVQLSGRTYGNLFATNCMFLTNTKTIYTSYKDRTVEAHSIFTNAAAMRVDGACTPIFGQNAGIDAGDAAHVPEWAVAFSDKDIYGNPRVMNGRIDIGAVEADWRPAYSGLLGRSAVVEGVSASVRIEDGVLTIPSGAISGKFTRAGSAVATFEIMGNGKLSAWLDGKLVGEFTAGTTEATLGQAVEGSTFKFAYEPGEDDAGYACLRSLGARRGMILIFR